jgi:hypothetical protein
MYIGAERVIGHSIKFLQRADSQRLFADAALGGGGGVQAFDAGHEVTICWKNNTTFLSCCQELL